MGKDFSARIITLPEAYENAYKIARQITDHTQTFDVIIGISRGGLPPARMICDFLNVETLTSLQVRHYTGGGKSMDQLEVTDPVDIDLREKSVLIVDDVNDSGKTLRMAHDHISALGPSLIQTAVLHEKSNTTYNAKYTGSDLTEWKWLIYQWALTEDLLEFLKNDEMLLADRESIIGHLKDKYGLKIDNELLKKVISMKKNYFSD